MWLNSDTCKCTTLSNMYAYFWKGLGRDGVLGLPVELEDVKNGFVQPAVGCCLCGLFSCIVNFRIFYYFFLTLFSIDLFSL